MLASVKLSLNYYMSFLLKVFVTKSSTSRKIEEYVEASSFPDPIVVRGA